MTTEKFFELAESSGFSTVAPLDVKTLRFMPEVREMCAADRCRTYNKSWSCPPACGDLDFWRGKAEKFSKGLILQTIGEREDSYDFESMMEVSHQAAENFVKYQKKLNAEGANYLLLTAGTCTRCKQCTYPDAPCRFPETLTSSMEACGLFVSQVCKDNGVQYNYGDEHIAFTGCVLFD